MGQNAKRLERLRLDTLQQLYDMPYDQDSKTGYDSVGGVMRVPDDVEVIIGTDGPLLREVFRMQGRRDVTLVDDRGLQYDSDQLTTDSLCELVDVFIKEVEAKATKKTMQLTQAGRNAVKKYLDASAKLDEYFDWISLIDDSKQMCHAATDLGQAVAAAFSCGYDEDLVEPCSMADFISTMEAHFGYSSDDDIRGALEKAIARKWITIMPELP